LKEDMKFDDTKTEIPRSLMDDEYANAGVRDPKIFITTSRKPSSRLVKFVKELRLIFPNAIKVNRGAYILPQLVSTCRENEVTDLILVHETRGEPDGLIVCHLPYGPTAYFSLLNCVLRHDVEEKKTVSEAFPHLVFHRFDSKLGERVQNILKYLFPVPKPDSKRVITFANYQNDYISFRHHVYKQAGKNADLTEVGPRFEMKLYQIKLGTLDMLEAENEWVLRPYMSNSRTKNYLSSIV